MKKRLTSFIALLLTGCLILTACGVDATASKEPEPVVDINFVVEQIREDPVPEQNILYETGTMAEGIYHSSIVQIAYATDELLSDFDFIYEFDYKIVHDINTVSEQNIVLWADVPLKDFSIIKVETDIVDDNALVSMVDAWKVADVVEPGQAVVIKGYFGTGKLPGSGFRFVDENWVTHFYSFIENMGYPEEPGPYRWLIWRFNGTTGQRDGLMVS